MYCMWQQFATIKINNLESNPCHYKSKMKLRPVHAVQCPIEGDKFAGKIQAYTELKSYYIDYAHMIKGKGEYTCPMRK